MLPAELMTEDKHHRQSHCCGQHGGKGQPGAVKIEGGKHGGSHSQQQGQAIPALIAHG